MHNLADKRAKEYVVFDWLRVSPFSLLYKQSHQNVHTSQFQCYTVTPSFRRNAVHYSSDIAELTIYQKSPFKLILQSRDSKRHRYMMFIAFDLRNHYSSKSSSNFRWIIRQIKLEALHQSDEERLKLIDSETPSYASMNTAAENCHVSVNTEFDLVLFHLEPSFRAEDMRIRSPKFRVPVICSEIREKSHPFLKNHLVNHVTIFIESGVVKRYNKVLTCLAQKFGTMGYMRRTSLINATVYSIPSYSVTGIVLLEYV